MGERLSLDEITQRAWSLHRPNGDCRSDLVFLDEGGIILGYRHQNEAWWAPHRDGIAFLSAEGAITSISTSIGRNDSGAYEIHMIHTQIDAPAHRLVEIDSPTAAERRPELRRIHGPGSAARSAARRIAPAGTRNFQIEVNLPDAATPFLHPLFTRAFFIANNKDLVAPAVFAGWKLNGRDVVVQYNRPMFFDDLLQYNCHKVHFFDPSANSCRGFSDDGQPDTEYSAQEYCSLTFATVQEIPPILKPYLDSLAGRARYMAVTPDWHTALHHCYPSQRASSCAYMSIGLFRMLNLIRSQQDRPQLELFTIGFDGTAEYST